MIEPDFFSQPCTICGGRRDWQLNGHPQAVCYACAHAPLEPRKLDAKGRAWAEYRMGVIDIWTLAERVGIPNMGEPPKWASTIAQRLMAQRMMRLGAAPLPADCDGAFCTSICSCCGFTTGPHAHGATGTRRCPMTSCALFEGHVGACAREHSVGCALDKDHIGPCGVEELPGLGMPISATDTALKSLLNPPPDDERRFLDLYSRLRSNEIEVMGDGKLSAPSANALRLVREHCGICNGSCDDYESHAQRVEIILLRRRINRLITTIEQAAWARMHVCKPPLGNPTREEAIDALHKIRERAVSAYRDAPPVIAEQDIALGSIIAIVSRCLPE